MNSTLSPRPLLPLPAASMRAWLRHDERAGVRGGKRLRHCLGPPLTLALSPCPPLPLPASGEKAGVRGGTTLRRSLWPPLTLTLSPREWGEGSAPAFQLLVSQPPVSTWQKPRRAGPAVSSHMVSALVLAASWSLPTPQPAPGVPGLGIIGHREALPAGGGNHLAALRRLTRLEGFTPRQRGFGGFVGGHIDHHAEAMPCLTTLPVEPTARAQSARAPASDPICSTSPKTAAPTGSAIHAPFAPTSSLWPPPSAVFALISQSPILGGGPFLGTRCSAIALAHESSAAPQKIVVEQQNKTAPVSPVVGRPKPALSRDRFLREPHPYPRSRRPCYDGSDAV